TKEGEAQVVSVGRRRCAPEETPGPSPSAKGEAGGGDGGSGGTVEAPQLSSERGIHSRASVTTGPVLVAIMGGTILTAGPQGTIEKGTVLIRDGKIAAVSRDFLVPTGATVIDATGRYLMPGIIDCHSHTAIEENVNECSDSVTAEVRIADVIDHRDVNI